MNIKSYTIRLMGIVQGVGFRPYVYNLALKNNIRGLVNNSGAALIVEAEGIEENIKIFINQLVNNPPSLSRIEKVEVVQRAVASYKAFTIEESNNIDMAHRFIAADVSVCNKCMEEVYDINSRWFKYPFTNCTECGPRYSIIEDFPYDRRNTAMKEFEMCDHCKRDYEDPQNRRFHAEPTCCPKCGPSLAMYNEIGEKYARGEEISKAVEEIKKGRIIAVKGLGGFHLICNGEDEEAIKLLRHRKKRPHKPLAIMAKDTEAIREICHMNTTEQLILEGNKKPILLLDKRTPFKLSVVVAPDTKKVGVFLPYTPLHFMLFQEGIRYLVMTSGNISNSPIQYKNNEAASALKSVADYFLVNNRDIYTPVDDSVIRVVEDQEMVVRVGRGYSPLIMKLETKREVLALGGEQKNTVSVGKNGYGYMSQYLGDINNADGYSNHLLTIEHLIKVTAAKPEVIAYDMHPSFTSRLSLENFKGMKVPVQHHHAHMVSCMAEHKLKEPVIGVIFDGTGYGLDGGIWGGEFFIGTTRDFKRVGHLKYIAIQGGDQAVKEPWRAALCYLSALGYDPKKWLGEIEGEKLEVVLQALKNSLNCYKTSSIGRLFDSVSALLGLCYKISYEAQGAIILENTIDSEVKDSYTMGIISSEGMFEIDYKELFKELLGDIEIKIPVSVISSKFHNGLISATEEMVIRLNSIYGISEVVLSGGCFENQYLLLNLVKRLKARGLKVFYNQKVPINDSGISLGQLVIADQIIQG
ncbi:carbamoyltransferase HypF [Alloiococcus sp. CFN-8]|uniref:carbamoyltransferase HypF n=1 Tax=Alloiococcus sp. CFN-8 TaxID=3416081 RepID=UPI003CEDE368